MPFIHLTTRNEKDNDDENVIINTDMIVSIIDKSIYDETVVIFLQNGQQIKLPTYMPDNKPFILTVKKKNIKK